MAQAEVISLGEVRASKKWASLRQQLHDVFDHWLDDLQAQLPEPETTLDQITNRLADVCDAQSETCGNESLADHWRGLGEQLANIETLGQ